MCDERTSSRNNRILANNATCEKSTDINTCHTTMNKHQMMSVELAFGRELL